jgi:hypothetical protein
MPRGLPWRLWHIHQLVSDGLFDRPARCHHQPARTEPETTATAGAPILGGDDMDGLMGFGAMVWCLSAGDCSWTAPFLHSVIHRVSRGIIATYLLVSVMCRSVSFRPTANVGGTRLTETSHDCLSLNAPLYVPLPCDTRSTAIPLQVLLLLSASMEHEQMDATGQ